jgi:hypothetical protein
MDGLLALVKPLCQMLRSISAITAINNVKNLRLMLTLASALTFYVLGLP